MRGWLSAILFVVFPGLAGAVEPSVQEALLRAKPAVVLIVAEVGSDVVLSCGPGGDKHVTPAPFRETGTGWFVSPSGWLMTNAHVVSPAHQPPQWVVDQQARRAAREACGELEPGALAAVTAQARVRLQPSIYALLSNGTRLPATITKYSPPVAGEGMSGRDLALLKVDAVNMPSLKLIGSSADAQIGDRIHILGFPGVVLSHELLNASAKMEASVTSGAISGFKQDIANQPVVQTDAPAAWGNSGGPVATPKGEVFGVLTFVSTAGGESGGIVQGFNFVIPSATVREFLEGTPVPLDEPSKFNMAWYAGLQEFFAGNYSQAERHFADADRLLPNLPDVRRLANEAKNPPPRPFPWGAVSGTVIVTSLGAYGVMAALRWRRNRFRIRPAEVMRLLETTEPRPIILDVREAATYDKSPVRIAGARHVTPQELSTSATGLDIDPARTVVAYCT